MLTDTADIRLAVAGRMMIKQLERLRDLRPIVRCHSRVRLVFHQLQDLLHTMRRILAGIMQVTNDPLLPCAPQRCHDAQMSLKIVHLSLILLSLMQSSSHSLGSFNPLVLRLLHPVFIHRLSAIPFRTSSGKKVWAKLTHIIYMLIKCLGFLSQSK